MQFVGLVLDGLASAAAVVAIYIAVRAERRTGAAVVRERRLDYELDLLRDIAGHAACGGPSTFGWSARLRVMVLTLPGNQDLPLLRVFTNARPTDAARRQLDELEHRFLSCSGTVLQGSGGTARWEMLNQPSEHSTLTPWQAELEAAITRRLNRE